MAWERKQKALIFNTSIPPSPPHPLPSLVGLCKLFPFSSQSPFSWQLLRAWHIPDALELGLLSGRPFRALWRSRCPSIFGWNPCPLLSPLAHILRNQMVSCLDATPEWSQRGEKYHGNKSPGLQMSATTPWSGDCPPSDSCRPLEKHGCFLRVTKRTPFSAAGLPVSWLSSHNKFLALSWGWTFAASGRW